jgi:hypothetical protein
MATRRRLTLVAAATVGGVRDLLRRHRSASLSPAPPLTTQSSPGQIADLQEAYGAEMAPPPAPDGRHER